MKREEGEVRGCEVVDVFGVMGLFLLWLWGLLLVALVVVMLGLVGYTLGWSFMMGYI